MEDKQLTTTDLIAKITDHNKLRFLDAYSKCGCMITKTAEAIGMSWQAIYYWIAKDEDFSKAFETLKKDLEIQTLEKHLNNIDDISFDPKTPPQTRILGSIFKVKAYDHRFKDKIVPDINFSGDIVVQSSIPRPVIEGEYKEITENATE